MARGRVSCWSHRVEHMFGLRTLRRASTASAEQDCPLSRNRERMYRKQHYITYMLKCYLNCTDSIQKEL